MTLPPQLKSCETRPGASKAAVLAAEQALSRGIPEDYQRVLLQTDGLEGFIGEYQYIVLWAVADLVGLNQAYSVAEFAPGVTLLGTNGADTGYGFREQDGVAHYVQVPLVGMDLSHVSVLGETFQEMLNRLASESAQ
jgi:cell wall assembly regulator SMI1